MKIRDRLNKRQLDLWAHISGALALLSAVPYEKEFKPIADSLPPWILPIIIKVSVFAGVGLKIMAFFAPPTASDKEAAVHIHHHYKPKPKRKPAPKK